MKKFLKNSSKKAIATTLAIGMVLPSFQIEKTFGEEISPSTKVTIISEKPDYLDHKKYIDGIKTTKTELINSQYQAVDDTIIIRKPS